MLEIKMDTFVKQVNGSLTNYDNVMGATISSQKQVKSTKDLGFGADGPSQTHKQSNKKDMLPLIETYKKTQNRDNDK
jgi:hypothetical protein